MAGAFFLSAGSSGWSVGDEETGVLHAGPGPFEAAPREGREAVGRVHEEDLLVSESADDDEVVLL
jgi:hypothetical protein